MYQLKMLKLNYIVVSLLNLIYHDNSYHTFHVRLNQDIVISHT